MINFKIYHILFVLLITIALGFMITGCNSSDGSVNKQTNDINGDDQIFYVSLNKAINQGQLDGFLFLNELKEKGNFGLGSTAQLSYELVILDGTAYGIPSDGKVYELPDSMKIPFAAVKFFEPDTKHILDTSQNLKNLEEIENQLGELLDQNSFAAIKISGTFSYIKYRSFNTQTPPYKATDNIPDVLFEKENIKATLVGFYTPKSAEVLNSPVYHFHFVDEDKTTGGHVLGLAIENAEVEIDYAEQLSVALAPPEILEHINLDTLVNN